MRLVLFALVLLSQIAQANNRLQARSFQGKKDSAILSFIPGNIERMRTPIINELVSGDIPKLEVPSFPRYWTELTKSEVLTSTTKLGGKIPIVDLGAKLSLEFKYALKTGFVIVSSAAKPSSKMSKARSVAELPDNREVLVLDDTTFQNYANVTRDNPMVGFCVYEASMTMEKSVEGGFNFIVEETTKKSSIETMSNATFSNFFQIRGDVPVNTYLNDICGGIFKTEFESVVVNDLSKMVLEKLISQNPKSDCSPSRANADVEEGDVSCQQWHADFPENIQHLTVPRCMLQKNGTHHCRLKAREGTACNLYVDPKTKKFSATFADFENSVLATENNFAYSCDKKAGLTCVMEKKPTLLHGIPLFPGRARCQSIQK